MLSKVATIWLGYVFVFTLIPMSLVSIYGSHPVFAKGESNHVFHFISAFTLLLGALIPFLIDIKVFRLKGLFNLTLYSLKFLILIFIVSHVMIYLEYGTSFRHHIRISSMGTLGYFYALEQTLLVPITFFLLRLVVCGAAHTISKFKIFLTAYGFILIMYSFNIFNLVCGTLIILALYLRKLVNSKSSFFSSLLLAAISIVALFGATYLIKGDRFENLSAVARYLQYRISIWYISADLLADMRWENRLAVFSEAFSDEASINTQNANIIFTSTFANPRVGAGPGIVGSSLYLLPFPLNLFLVTLYGSMLSYFLRCSGLFDKNRSTFLVLAVFCLLFPFMGGPIQYVSLELIPVINLLLLVYFLTVKIPVNQVKKSRVKFSVSSKGVKVGR